MIRLTSAVAAAALLIALSGCGEDTESVQTPTPSIPDAAPENSDDAAPQTVAAVTSETIEVNEAESDPPQVTDFETWWQTTWHCTASQATGQTTKGMVFDLTVDAGTWTITHPGDDDGSGYYIALPGRIEGSWGLGLDGLKIETNWNGADTTEWDIARIAELLDDSRPVMFPWNHREIDPPEYGVVELIDGGVMVSHYAESGAITVTICRVA